MPSVFLKDPHAGLDYTFNWSGWLSKEGDTISSYVITADAGITVVSDSKSSGKIIVWLSGGTAGNVYTVACRVTTVLGRIEEQSMQIRVQEK